MAQVVVGGQGAQTSLQATVVEELLEARIKINTEL